MPRATAYVADYYDGTGIPQAVLGMLCVAFAMQQPGTGGLQTLDYYKARSEMGYPLVRSEPIPQESDEYAQRTPAEDLAHIRSLLRPAMADLANAFGVSRQAVYDWQAGNTVATGNAMRLADLGRAADVLAAEGISGSAQILRRSIHSGQNLLDIVRNGGSAEQAATTLAGIIRRETQQRAMLASRLKSRPRRSVGGEELGAPILDEVAEPSP